MISRTTLTIGASVLLSLGSIASADGPAYELRFWPGSDAKSDPRLVEIAEHPCGSVAIAKVKSMPPPKKGQALEPERVVELSPNGKVIRRWAIPVDYTPVGIRGNSILVQLSQSRRLWLDLKGNINPADVAQSVPAPEAAKCDGLKEFGNSAYAQCWTYPDLQDKQPRVLAFEGVCT